MPPTLITILFPPLSLSHQTNSFLLSSSTISSSASASAAVIGGGENQDMMTMMGAGPGHSSMSRGCCVM